VKQTTHENIKQLDITTGGSFYKTHEKSRINTINHPILIIGLGGTGTDALLRLKHQVSRRFKLPDNPVTKQKKSKPDNIEYLSLETNEHEKKNYKGISLDPYTETVLLSNAGIGAILNNRSTMPDYISSWLNPELTITDGTKGASGNRQAGRLLLFEKINTTIDAIDNKIRSLRVNQENKLLVYILSGLCGGTGGGMFLDTAYIIRGLMEREYGSKGVDKVEIMGYLFTPDVHLSGNQMNIHTEEYIQRNGYAALKELDYWMNLEERQGERFNQKYGTRLQVNSALAPFNLCHLVSSVNTQGVHLKGAYDYCLNVTAENIVNFIAQEDKSSSTEFLIQDYNSNLLSNISTMKSNLPPGMPGSANFVYNIIGASTATLPTEGINACLASSLFKEIEQIFENAPDDHDLQEFAQTTGLEINFLGQELMRRLPQIKLNYAETDYYSYNNVIKTGRVNIDEKLKDQYNNAKRELSQAKFLTEEIITSVKKELNEFFTNPKKGPFYVSKLITYDRGPCLIARLHTCVEHLKEKISISNEELENLEIQNELRLEEAKKSFFLSKESKKNAYIETKIVEYQTRMQSDVYKCLIEVFKDISTGLTLEYDRVYYPYTETLEKINEIINSNINFVYEEKLSDTSKSYEWNVISSKDVIPEINKLSEEIGADVLTREFTKSMLLESSKWLNDKDVNISEAVSDFIYNRYSSLLSKTMSAYLSMKYGKDRSIESIVEEEIAPKLYRDAKPIFHLDNASGMFNFPSYGVVSIPKGCPDILRGIESYQQHALANLRFNIRKSNISDRIFWLNTQNGIPLFAYTPIRVYEELYERTINTKEGVGRHLVMNENENWVNLPSPIPEELWGDTYENPRQKILNENAENIFNLGLNTGIIEEKNGRFICKINGEEKYVSSKDMFMRQPNLIRLVETEINNQKTISKNEEEKDHTDDFLKILVCEAIVKRGAHYLYEKELEEDPWQPFVNLIDESDYPEYAMYKHYKSLSYKHLEILKKKAKSHEETWPIDKLILNLKKWQGTIAVRKNKLDTEMWKIKNGESVYNFYKSTLLRLNAQVTALAY